jgi:HD superfamily phosphohydrolase YqeK
MIVAGILHDIAEVCKDDKAKRDITIAQQKLEKLINVTDAGTNKGVT